MKNNCEFCKRTFVNKHTLKYHQKTAKYCLKIQNKPQDNSCNFKCPDCHKNFTSHYNLDRHINKCSLKFARSRQENKQLITESNKLSSDLQEYKSKYLTLLEEHNDLKRDYERKIQVLQDKLENVAIQAARKPTHTNTTYNRNQINTIIQNMSPVTDESFNSNTHHLTIEHLKRGVKGYVEYALNYPSKDRVLCVDYSRRKIKYKDSDGEVQTDPRNE